jgi:hypothetical protein
MVTAEKPVSLEVVVVGRLLGTATAAGCAAPEVVFHAASALLVSHSSISVKGVSFMFNEKGKIQQLIYDSKSLLSNILQ